MTLESIIHWLGGLLAYITLGAVFYGIWRGTQQKPGLSTGRNITWLRSPWFYVITSAIYFGICFLGWVRLPWSVSPSLHGWLLALGALVYFPGMSLTLWARLALGRNYFVSTGMGAQLFEEHRLVTSGPFSIVRHPMYFGILLAAFGSLLIYHTWTTLLFACFAPFLLNRARREEKALADGFGQRWHEYCDRVPMFLPRLSNLSGKTLLVLAATGSFTVALVHLGAIFIGPAAYRLLGAGEDFAAWAETGSILPGLITIGLTVIFATFGGYALSGAGLIRRLPLLTLGLLGIASVYTLRGLVLFVELGMMVFSHFPLDALNLFYSAISLTIGLVHFAGIKANWKYLRSTLHDAPRHLNG